MNLVLSRNPTLDTNRKTFKFPSISELTGWGREGALDDTKPTLREAQRKSLMNSGNNGNDEIRTIYGFSSNKPLNVPNVQASNDEPPLPPVTVAFTNFMEDATYGVESHMLMDGDEEYGYAYYIVCTNSAGNKTKVYRYAKDFVITEQIYFLPIEFENIQQLKDEVRGSYLYQRWINGEFKYDVE